MRTGEKTHAGFTRTSIGPNKVAIRHNAHLPQDGIATRGQPTEQRHFDGGPYFMASDHVDDDRELPPDKTYTCRTCGNTIVGRPPRECPICGAPPEEFDVTK